MRVVLDTSGSALTQAVEHPIAGLELLRMDGEEAEGLAGLGCWQYGASDHSVWWSDQMFRNIGRDPSLGAPPDLFAADLLGRL